MAGLVASDIPPAERQLARLDVVRAELRLVGTLLFVFGLTGASLLRDQAPAYVPALLLPALVLIAVRLRLHQLEGSRSEHMERLDIDPVTDSSGRSHLLLYLRGFSYEVFSSETQKGEALIVPSEPDENTVRLAFSGWRQLSLRNSRIAGGGFEIPTISIKDDWKHVVHRTANYADAVVLLFTSLSSGIIYELALLERHKLEHKTIVLVKRGTASSIVTTLKNRGTYAAVIETGHGFILSTLHSSLLVSVPVCLAACLLLPATPLEWAIDWAILVAVAIVTTHYISERVQIKKLRAAAARLLRKR